MPNEETFCKKLLFIRQRNGRATENLEMNQKMITVDK